MANLDTREKRASSIAISLYPAGPSIQSGSSGLDDEDRQIAGYGYSAISVAAVITAVLTGTTIAGGLLESEMVAGGETSIITLALDTWEGPGGAFNSQRQAIIDGFDSAQGEGTGWNAEVRDKEGVTAVVRTSSTVVTVTWTTAAAAYAITADETIECTVPAAVLVTSADPVTATPTFVVTNESVAGRIMGAIAGTGGLAGPGGIAGKAGGLAG